MVTMMSPCYVKPGFMPAVQADRQTDRQTDRQAGRQADRQAGRQTGRQPDRHAGRQACRPPFTWRHAEERGHQLSKHMTDSIHVPMLCAELTMSLHVKAAVTADCPAGTMQTVW